MLHPFPHRYRAAAFGGSSGPVSVETAGVDTVPTQPPAEFGGPGGAWSPETLLVAAVADCFILSFRAIARASKLEWEELSVDVEGLLERPDGVTRFTRFDIAPRLRIASRADETRARAMLEKAEHTCLISNSLRAEFVLEPEVLVNDVSDEAPVYG